MSSDESGAPASKRRGGPPAEHLREQLEREFGEVPPESPSEPVEEDTDRNKDVDDEGRQS